MKTEVVLVQGGGATWSRVSESGDDPQAWEGTGSPAGSLLVTVHSVASEPELSEFAQACNLVESAGYDVVLSESYKRLTAWLNADGTGWPPKNWQPGDAVLTPGVRNVQGDGGYRV